MQSGFMVASSKINIAGAEMEAAVWETLNVNKNLLSKEWSTGFILYCFWNGAVLLSNNEVNLILGISWIQKLGEIAFAVASWNSHFTLSTDYWPYVNVCIWGQICPHHLLIKKK